MKTLLICALIALPISDGASQDGTSAVSPAVASILGAAEAQRNDVDQARYIQQYAANWNATAANIRASGQVQILPKAIKMIAPVYPPEKHFGNKEDTVHIEFVVNERGDVIFSTPIDVTADNFSFSASAMVAVWQWKFSPGLMNGVPVKVRMIVPIVFSLQ